MTNEFNPVIQWRDDNPLFKDFGKTIEVENTQAVDTLAYGVIFAIREVSWENFICQVVACLKLGEYISEDFKLVISLAILISMNRIKAKVISDEFAEGYKHTLIKEDKSHYLDLARLKSWTDSDDIEKVVDWFVKNEIGYLSDDNLKLYLNNYIVSHMTII